MPKSLLPLGGKPLLERTIQYLGAYGITEYVLCVAYLKKQIMDSIKDGSHLGVKVEYAEADVPLGTGGQLKTAESLVKGGPFLLLNGDIVTNLNISALIAAHKSTGAVATIAVKRFEVKIPYGNITVKDGGLIAKFEEKPTLSYLANAGVYVISEGVFSSIPAGKQCSLEREVFPALLDKGQRLGYYYEDAYWADVGSMGDFERVNDDIALNDQKLADVK
jgi:mannose-1-phosphate guanylyltransferase/phosphomannomutase